MHIQLMQKIISALEYINGSYFHVSYTILGMDVCSIIEKEFDNWYISSGTSHMQRSFSRL